MVASNNRRRHTTISNDRLTSASKADAAHEGSSKRVKTVNQVKSKNVNSRNITGSGFPTRS